MVMKWFTRDFVNGALDDEEWERRRSEYGHHLSSIRANLGHGAEELVTSVNLHDAQLQNWRFEKDGTLQLRVLAGDLQVGYERVTLRYFDAKLVGATEEELRTWTRSNRPVEVIWDEVALAPDDNYEHRFLLRLPDAEFGIAFSSVGVSREAVDESERRVP